MGGHRRPGAYAGGVPTTAIPAEERQINLLLALRATRTGLSAAQILRDVAGYDPHGGASAARMFERDKDALRELGIAILTEGPADAVRYRIEESDYALPDLHLDAAQASAIALAASSWSDGALPTAARRALTKLRAVAEDGVGALPDLTVDLAGHEIPLPLLTAIEERRAVAFDYASSSPGSSGTTRARQVEPHRVTRLEGAWYLDGADQATGEHRRFRLARILGDVTPIGPAGAFEPPPPAAPETRTARLAVLPGRALGLRARARGAEPGEQNSEPWRGRDVIGVPYADPFSFAGALVALGDAVVVLEPADLREAVLSHLRGAARLVPDAGAATAGEE